MSQENFYLTWPQFCLGIISQRWVACKSQERSTACVTAGSLPICLITAKVPWSQSFSVWSKAPPLTACCLSPLSGFESRPRHVRKLQVTKYRVRQWFSSGTPVSSTTYNWLVMKKPQYGINVTKNEIPTLCKV